jgi:ABC-type multidrug transport system fused ATPase/permease subunit
LVGHSWGGKSTIIKILLRLYDYKSWEILFDWQELKSLKIESFYKEIWYLPQEPGIFDW